MLIQKTDKVSFVVYSRVNGELLNKTFSSYSEAVEVAMGLKETVFVDMRVINPEGNSGFTAPLFTVRNGEKTTVYGFYIKQLKDLGLAV